MNKKGFATFGTVAVVLVLIIAGGIWYYETHIGNIASAPTPPCCKTISNQTTTQSTTATNSSNVAVPPPSQPSGSATYTNPQYGFSFSYPTAWSLTIDSSTPNEVTFNTNATQLYSITWYQKNPQQSLLAWYKAQLASSGDGTVYSSTSSIINGYNGLDVYYLYPPGTMSEGNGQYDFLLSNNRTVLDFFWSPYYFQDQGAEAVVDSVRFQ